ncbi:dpy-19-like 1, like isoform X1 [Alosa alosa]|uniref:dpy-19-like 1, like isoform X1 n=1 Tax=Alosa alosa TaxID=278164 RepID=UPI0020155443|nr:dpy-19-like 1, like isoform X1 [Alosa alosa]XP_048117427.1 dpy-19-like 1, like isoform X1 [Alosa alosa]XP_048117428.1 dpy-19-like 1, like isoform X1 [Alosa alosa]
MVAKTRRQNAKDQTPQSNGKDRSPFVSPSHATGKSRRSGKDGKGSAGFNLLQYKGGMFPGFPFIRNKTGLGPSAFMKIGITLVLAIVAGFIHWYHLTHLFENDRHFSHLSALEKEMAFRTEMGLYYSYYKTIIEAPTFLNGLYMIMNDRLTEYPLIINTLKRFNLYPEVLLAFWYRTYTGIMDFFGIPTKMCWSINRGEGLDAVESCEGMGDPASFYVTFVFLVNGAMMSLFFIYGTYLSGSRIGGVVTVLCFFFNHGESTRVMWTPPLRESFSYPFLVLQMLLLTHILRARKPSTLVMVALGISNVLFMLPWQFAQFVLLTQVASLFASYILGYLTPSKMQSLLVTHMISLGVCFVLMFGNAMLLTSFYASSLVSICVIVAMREKFAELFQTKLVSWIMQGLAWVVSTVILKSLLSAIFGASDDAHISSLIKSKFTNYKDFDTMMYTCAAEFDFMEIETPLRYIKTLLLPLNMLIVAIIAGRTVQDALKMLREYEGVSVKEELAEDDSDEPQVSARGELVYHALQLVAFAVLATLIMRLKLFLTPHMCIMASLICSRQLFGWVGERFKLQMVAFAIISIMAVQGAANLQGQWGIMGEFSNLPQEELLDWVSSNTGPNDVFAGAMPTMASVKLSTGRPIVNHPHYEDAGLRARTKQVYSMYSRKPAEEVKANLMKLQVDYFVLEDSWCTRRSREPPRTRYRGTKALGQYPRPGCSMPEIWDLEDPQNAGKVPLCSIMGRDTRPHFTTVFQNSIYKVLRVPKSSQR